MIVNLQMVANWLRARATNDRGASLVEYALLVALIGVVCIAAVTTLGTKSSTKLGSAGTAIN
jgi:pilus assembly protein Flp/PilA